MQLLVACALLATASAIVITEETVDKKDLMYRLPKQKKSSHIANGQCSGSIPQEWLSCPVGLASLNVTVEDESQVSLNLHQMEKVYIFRSKPCVGVAHVRVETECIALVGANAGVPLPEVPRPRRHVLRPRSRQSPLHAARDVPLPPVPNTS